MYCDLVLKGCQSVLRTLVLVPLVLVFLFGSAKIGRSAIQDPHILISKLHEVVTDVSVKRFIL